MFSSEQLRVRPLTLLLFVCGAFFHRLDILGERMLIVHSIEIPHQTDSIDQRRKLASSVVVFTQTNRIIKIASWIVVFMLRIATKKEYRIVALTGFTNFACTPNT